MGMKSIPFELTSYLDETNELVKVLSDEGIDPSSLTSIRAMFAANDYFDQELQNIMEFSDDLDSYDHLIIEIDTLLDKYISKIEETENLPFNHMQIWK